MLDIVINRKLCVHCGACTAVCSVESLYIDLLTATLSFAEENCTKCAQCIEACPLRAISISSTSTTNAE
jgi:L-aspartate semialdehyde sulfurtransferase ferredoxin